MYSIQVLIMAGFTFGMVGLIFMGTLPGSPGFATRGLCWRSLLLEVRWLVYGFSLQLQLWCRVRWRTAYDIGSHNRAGQRADSGRIGIVGRACAGAVEEKMKFHPKVGYTKCDYDVQFTLRSFNPYWRHIL